MGRLISCYMPAEAPEAKKKSYDESLQYISRRLEMAFTKTDSISLDVYQKTLLDIWTNLESVADSIRLYLLTMPSSSQDELKTKVRSLSLSMVEAYRSHFPEYREIVDLSGYPDAFLAGFLIDVPRPPEVQVDRVDCLLWLIARINLLAGLVPGFLSPDHASLVVRKMMDEVKGGVEDSGNPRLIQETTGEVLALLERLASSGVSNWGHDGIGACLIRITRREITKALADIPTGELKSGERGRFLDRLSELRKLGRLFIAAFKVTRFPLGDFLLRRSGNESFEFAEDCAPNEGSIERKMEWVAGLIAPAELLQQYRRHGLVKGPLAAEPLESIIGSLKFLGPGNSTPEQQTAFNELKQRMTATLQDILTSLKNG